MNKQKYHLHFIECHNPFNWLPEVFDEEGDAHKAGIEEIKKTYKDNGAIAVLNNIDKEDDWVEMGITVPFEAENIEEAKKVAQELYSGSNDVFVVYNADTKEKVFDEEDC